MHQTIQSNTVALAPQNANHDFVAPMMTSLELVDFINDDRKAKAYAAGMSFPCEGYPKLMHKNFLAKVPEVLGATSADFSADLPDGYGRARRGYSFPKREACLMAMSYSYELQAKVFDRMTALESKPAAPADLSKLEILQMALESEKARVLLTVQVEAQAKKIDHLENLFKEGMSHVQFCKGLNGVNVMQVGHFLERRNWLYNESKSGTRYRVAAYARDKYMTEHQQEITPHGKEAFISYTPILLRKGAVRLYELYLAGELPMKKNWDGLHTHDKAVRGAA
ncbi:transporter [Pseudomonas plecoglossicida]|uniref:Transporter n=1 Tax=Pseudomonas plecoglossicida TaxID=70775 RepID=A0A2A3LVY4_PSEDL|nr:transporter [Pseudomonas plecoglossicida]PBJ91978.1 transporter [Pseudomonas plecoglossicida]